CGSRVLLARSQVALSPLLVPKLCLGTQLYSKLCFDWGVAEAQLRAHGRSHVQLGNEQSGGTGRGRERAGSVGWALAHAVPCPSPHPQTSLGVPHTALRYEQSSSLRHGSPPLVPGY